VVRIPSAKRRLDAYPHEMSGGMRQRAMIALALACKPKILLADEPTTALDATVQRSRFCCCCASWQREFGMSVIFVTHDIGRRDRNLRSGRGDVCRPDRRAGHAQPDRALTGPSLARGLLASTVHGAKRGQRLGTISGNAPLARQGADQLFLSRRAAVCGSPLPRAAAALNVPIGPDPDCKVHPGGTRRSPCGKITRRGRSTLIPQSGKTRRCRESPKPGILQIGVVTSGNYG